MPPRNHGSSFPVFPWRWIDHDRKRQEWKISVAIPLACLRLGWTWQDGRLHLSRSQALCSLIDAIVNVRTVSIIVDGRSQVAIKAYNTEKIAASLTPRAAYRPGQAPGKSPSTFVTLRMVMAGVGIHV